MKKFLILFLLFGSVLFVGSLVPAQQCSGQCSYNDSCYDIGAVMNDLYCDFSTLNFISQNGVNSSCMNDFECLSGHCLDDVCTSYAELAALGNISVENLTALLSQGNCTVKPGCLNQTSLTNAHSTNNLCVLDFAGYTCFECNSDYTWNSSLNACELKACDGDVGCRNASNITNATNITGRCLEGYTCFDCNSHYRWNSSEEKCIYYTPASVQSAKTITLSSDALKRNYRNDFIIDDRVKFYLLGEEHSMKVMDISKSSVELEIRSLPQTVDLSEGEIENIDLNGDGINDFFVRLNNVDEYESADLTIGFLEQPSQQTSTTTSSGSQQTTTPTAQTLPASSSSNEKTGKSAAFWIILSLLVILALAVLGIIIYNLSKKSGEKKMDSRATQNFNTQPKYL